MRIHTDTLTLNDLRLGADLARVQFTRLSEHGSRSRDHAFDITLTGESKRHQNGGPDKAATWDQWGVFLAWLFYIDPNAKMWAYDGVGEFHRKTDWRFDNGWPTDAHGDHTFRYSGMPYQQQCTKCTAVTRWEP